MASLKAAAEDKSNPSVSKVTSFAVDPNALEAEEGDNIRPLNMDHVAEMSLAYRSGAVFPPLDVMVEDGRIKVIDGFHRRAAALDAIAKGAPVRALECRQFRGNDADRVAHMITSSGGLPLTPLQRGVQYRKLIGFGWTEKQIADRVGKSAQHVQDMLVLAEANSDVHKAINAGKVSGTTAVKLVKEHGSKAGQVIRDGLEQAQASGKAKVTPRVLAKQRARSAPQLKVTLEWLPVPANLPDADTTVLLALAEGEACTGYLDAETWRDTSGMPLGPSRVTHYMHLPAVPAVTQPEQQQA
jgi:ParB-like chromosome segregation protein Spo0J